MTYSTVADAKTFLMINGFKISEVLLGGEFFYKNSKGQILTLRIYKNTSGARIY